MENNQSNKAAQTAGAVSTVLHTILKVIGTLLLIVLTTGLLFACIFAYYVKTNLSQELDVSLEEMSLNLSSTIYYTDDSGTAQTLAALHGTENRVWVEYANIPQNMEHAAVAIEDQRFYKHHGVDWYRTVAAFGNMFLSMKSDFGGSTITQQLIKNVTQQNDITVQRKILEIFRALKLEKMYSKSKIMEWYLNVIYLGEGCNGVGTAAKTYFDKDVMDLDLAECASIIAITNNPSKYDPYISRKNNKARQELILDQMYKQGYISQEDYKNAVAEQLTFKRGEDEQVTQTVNSYYTEAVIADVTKDLMEQKGINKSTAQNLIYNGGLQIYSCLDKKAQDIVDSVYTNTKNFPSSKSPNGESVQSAIVLLDPSTGEIKALYGGIGTKTENLIFNRATDAKRPAGSSIKPLSTYGPGVDQGLITPTTLVSDSQNIKLNGTTWFPKNDDLSYRGTVTIQQALVSSLNTVSAQILDKLTPQVSYKYLTDRLGFTSLVQADCDYAPLALGQFTKGVTVREMAQGFDALANNGVFTYSRTYTKVLDSKGNVLLDNPAQTDVAFKENTAWTMDQMLEAAATYGTGSESYFGAMAHAGKTGTTSDNTDRWFVGFTPYYCAAVWTGYDTPAHMYVSGNPAAQIWKKVMQPLHEGLAVKQFKKPTASAPTNIFGDTVIASPSPSPSPSGEASPSPSGGSQPAASPEPSSAPEPSAPVVTPESSDLILDFDLPDLPHITFKKVS